MNNEERDELLHKIKYAFSSMTYNPKGEYFNIILCFKKEEIKDIAEFFLLQPCIKISYGDE